MYFYDLLLTFGGTEDVDMRSFVGFTLKIENLCSQTLIVLQKQEPHH
jgi:hypothetical protein